MHVSRTGRNLIRLTLRGGLVSAALLLLLCRAATAQETQPATQPASAPATQEAQTLEPDQALKEIFAYQSGKSTDALDVVAADVRTANAQRRDQLVKQFAGALKSSKASDDSKRFLCTQLAILNTPQAISVLARAMDDPSLFHAARQALQPLPDPSAGQVLRNALETNDAARLTALMDTLAARRDPDACKRIGQLIERGSQGVAASAISALARIGGPEADTALARAQSRAPGYLRPAIAQARLRCAKQMVADGYVDEAMNTCEQIVNGSGPLVLRKAALQGLVQTQPTRAAATLAKLLNGPERELAAQADSYARSLPGTDVTVALGENIETLPEHAQRALIDVLDARNDVAARPALIKALKSSSRATRLAALAALAKVGDAGLVPVLAETATGSDGELASAARKTLHQMPGRTVDQAILWAMKDAKPPVRIELVRALGQRNADWTVPDLLTALQDPDPRVRAELFTALGHLAEPDLLKRLIDGMIQASDPAEKTAAESAVVECARRIENPDDRPRLVLAAMNRSKDPATRARLLKLAGQLGGKPALQAARKMLNQKDPTARAAAVTVLADWPDESVLPDLLKIVRNDDDPDCQAIALRGYLRIAKARAATDSNAAAAMYRDALQRAKRPQEKRLALTAVAETPSRDAMTLAAAHLDDKDIKDHAAQATITIAAAIARRYRHQTRTAMEQVLKSVSDPTLTGKAQAVLDQLAASKDHILVWQISGPYDIVDKTVAQMFDAPLGPEVGGAAATWKPAVAGGDASRPWAVDIAKALGAKPEDCVAYLRTRIYSPKEQPARLETGSDDGLKAWLNNQQVLAVNTNRRISAGQDVTEVTLHQGWNVLLLKVTQSGGDFSAAARLRAPDGAKLEGLLESAD